MMEIDLFDTMQVEFRTFQNCENEYRQVQPGIPSSYQHDQKLVVGPRLATSLRSSSYSITTLRLNNTLVKQNILYIHYWHNFPKYILDI